jgi:hypothetical protein
MTVDGDHRHGHERTQDFAGLVMRHYLSVDLSERMRENGCTFFCRLCQSMRTRERDDGGGMGNETFGALGISSSAKNEERKQ